MNLLKFALTIVVISAANTASATDLTDMFHVLNQMYGVDVKQLSDLENLSKLESQLRNINQKQLDNMLSQLNAMTGHYGYGDLLNTNADFKARKWSSSSWENVIHEQGDDDSKAYQALQKHYHKEHPSLSLADMRKGADEPDALNYQQTVQVNQAANVQSSYAFNQLQQHVDNIHTLVNAIEHTANEKAIADLNARINAEVAYLNVEQIRMLTVLNQQYAQQVSQQLIDASERSIINRIPTEKET